MPHAILLLTNDALLAEKVRRALPTNIPATLTIAPAVDTAPEVAPARGWLLILCDSHALGRAAAAPPPSTSSSPVLWLGEAPTSSAIAAIPPAWRERIVDYLDRRLPASKLAFILQQHLSAAYLRHLRRVGTAVAHGGAASIGPRALPYDVLQHQLNNTLTGIIGNAALASELAADAGRRLQAPLALRLQRINELSVRLRDLLAAQPAPVPAANNMQPSAPVSGIMWG
ncbi:MAG TPA: hypothetical protein VN709_10035 [Terriglobales bacterium]|nr:hypothetical protein [Terriglobales bacterium]